MATKISPRTRRRLLVAPVMAGVLAFSGTPAFAAEQGQGQGQTQQAGDESNFIQRCLQMLGIDWGQDGAKDGGDWTGGMDGGDWADGMDSAQDGGDWTDGANGTDGIGKDGIGTDGADGNGRDGIGKDGIGTDGTDGADGSGRDGIGKDGIGTDGADGNGTNGIGKDGIGKDGTSKNGTSNSAEDRSRATRDSKSAGSPASGELSGLYSAFDKARADNGLEPLQRDAGLESKAEGWSATMAGSGDFSHNPNGGAENIYMASDGADGAIEAWLNSPGHRRNMLSPDYSSVGLGVATGAQGTYVTQNFS